MSFCYAGEDVPYRPGSEYTLLNQLGLRSRRASEDFCDTDYPDTPDICIIGTMKRFEKELEIFKTYVYLGPAPPLKVSLA